MTNLAFAAVLFGMAIMKTAAEIRRSRNDELEGSGSGDWDGNALEANAGAEDYSAVDNYECPKSSMPQHECQKREMAINATCILPTKASITIPSTFSSYHLRTAFYSGELSACFNETRNRETGQNIWSAEELAPWKACSSVSRSPNDLCGTKGQFAAATVDTWGVGCGRKHVSCMASRTDSRCKPTCVDKSGVHPDGTPSSPPNPVAIPCEDGKLKSKYHAEGGPAQWTGFDVALLTDLTGAGGMTFEIISMGSAFEISQRNVHRNITIPQSGQASGSVETLKGYTAEAHEMMKCECVDMFGQGTWRTNLQRVTKLGYVWSIPVVSDDVQFVSGSPVPREKSFMEHMFVFLAPFDWSAWVAILIAMVVYGIILVVIERIDEEHGMTFEMEADPVTGEDVQRELSTGEIAWNACVSLTGEHQIAAMSNQMRIVQAGWVYLVFILTAIYTANLATIFTEGTEYHFPINGIQTAAKGVNESTGLPYTFCLNKGSANDAYFSALAKDAASSFHSLENSLVRVAGTAGQIAGVLKTSDDPATHCDFAELTREDLYTWAKGLPADQKCKIQIVGAPITKRSRGIMMSSSNTCLQATVNNLYHQYELKGSAALLHGKYFVNPNCAGIDVEEVKLSLPFQELLGMFLIFFGIAFLTMVGSSKSCTKLMRRAKERVSTGVHSAALSHHTKRRH